MKESSLGLGPLCLLLGLGALDKGPAPQHPDVHLLVDLEALTRRRNWETRFSGKCAGLRKVLRTAMKDQLVNRHETVQIRRYEYEPPCPPPGPERIDG